MKTKLICTTLASLTMACSMANASHFLTDGKEGKGKQVGSYTGGTNNSGNGGSGNRTTNFVPENADFTNASHIKGKQDVQIGKELIRVNLEVLHVGDDDDIASDMRKFLKECAVSYKKGMTFSSLVNANTPKELAITDGITEKQRMKMQYLANFILDNLFDAYGNVRHITPNELFINFVNQKNGGIEDYNYNANAFMYSLMYFFDSNTSPIEIKLKDRTYNNYQFRFLPCTDATSGTKMNFLFDTTSSSSNRLADSKDTVKSSLSRQKWDGTHYGSFNAEYKFEGFAVSEDIYRLNVILSSSKFQSKEYGAPYNKSDLVTRKIANLLVEIK